VSPRVRVGFRLVLTDPRPPCSARVAPRCRQRVDERNSREIGSRTTRAAIEDDLDRVLGTHRYWSRRSWTSTADATAFAAAQVLPRPWFSWRSRARRSRLNETRAVPGSRSRRPPGCPVVETGTRPRAANLVVASSSSTTTPLWRGEPSFSLLYTCHENDSSRLGRDFTDTPRPPFPPSTGRPPALTVQAAEDAWKHARSGEGLARVHRDSVWAESGPVRVRPRADRRVSLPK